MENTEQIPGTTNDQPVQEFANEDSELMLYRQPRMPDNPFLTRGCCSSPRVYNKNEQAFRKGCHKNDSYDWLQEIPDTSPSTPVDVVEVRFKNHRKDLFRVPAELELMVGDIVAVEASPGHDIGIVCMAGELIRFHLHRKNLLTTTESFKKVYRKARLADIEKWISSVEMETATMFKARSIADRLGLSMKINDVEIQGDNTKAIFYYTADDRVDFRELIKLLAEEFKVRIEMRQIGARQEASRLGGIGSCGRELCCKTWMTDFRSVTTNAARIQQLSLNPQKLAGQCGKLKCCLNYEYDTYTDALKSIPNTEIRLKTKRGDAFHQKTDIFQKLLWYSYLTEPSEMIAIPADKVAFIQEENRKGNIPEKLEDFSKIIEQKASFDTSIVQDDLTRFDNL